MQEIKELLEQANDKLERLNDGIYALLCLVQNRQKNVMTVEDLARYLDITEYTVYKMTRNGKIPYKKLENGKRVYFLRDEIDEWLKQQKQ